MLWMFTFKKLLERVVRIRGSPSWERVRCGAWELVDDLPSHVFHFNDLTIDRDPQNLVNIRFVLEDWEWIAVAFSSGGIRPSSEVPARICFTLEIVNFHPTVLCSSARVIIERLPHNGVPVLKLQSNHTCGCIDLVGEDQ